MKKRIIKLLKKRNMYVNYFYCFKSDINIIERGTGEYIFLKISDLIITFNVISNHISINDVNGKLIAIE